MYIKVPKQIKLIQKRVTPLICFFIKEYLARDLRVGILWYLAPHQKLEGLKNGWLLYLEGLDAVIE